MIIDCVVYKIGRTKKVRITKTDKQLQPKPKLVLRQTPNRDSQIRKLKGENKRVLSNVVLINSSKKEHTKVFNWADLWNLITTGSNADFVGRNACLIVRLWTKTFSMM